jgi:hypothetical protein
LNSPKEYCEALQSRKIEEVFESGVPSLITIENKVGEAAVRAVVVLLLKEAIDFFNLTETMTDTQVATTCRFIIEEYPYFQLDDLKVCFANAMKGKYGKIYNRLDGSIVLEWLSKYDRDRCSLADAISFQDHKSEREAEISDGAITYKEYREQLKEKADNGDKEAQEALKVSNSVMAELEKRKIEKHP